MLSITTKLPTGIITATFRATKRLVLILAGTAMLSGTFVAVASADYKVTPGNGSGASCPLQQANGGGPDNTAPDGTVITATVADPADQQMHTVTNTCTNGKWVTTQTTTAPGARPGPSPVGATPSPGGVAVVKAVTTA
jgi:hypothetical protein